MMLLNVSGLFITSQIAFARSEREILNGSLRCPFTAIRYFPVGGRSISLGALMIVQLRSVERNNFSIVRKSAYEHLNIFCRIYLISHFCQSGMTELISTGCAEIQINRLSFPAGIAFIIFPMPVE